MRGVPPRSADNPSQRAHPADALAFPSGSNQAGRSGMIEREPYSWRQDSAVPAFADDRPVIVFDGHCVLCSG